MGHTTDDTRSLTEASFTRLLGRLDPDVERAGHEYARLRHTLVRFFDWRGASSPEECADATLDRLARRLEDTRVDDVRNYVHGIARLVLLERRRLPVLDPIDRHPELADLSTDHAPDQSTLRDCLDCCLSNIEEDGRLLVLGYYEGEGLAKITNRRRLAGGLGLSENALRSRVQRLRNRIEQCVEECVAVKE